MASTSRLDEIIAKVDHVDNPFFPDGIPDAEAKEQIKLLFLEVIGSDDIAKYDYNEATYGDYPADHRSAIVGRNELREELRQLVEAL